MILLNVLTRFNTLTRKYNTHEEKNQEEEPALSPSREEEQICRLKLRLRDSYSNQVWVSMALVIFLSLFCICVVVFDLGFCDRFLIWVMVVEEEDPTWISC